MLLDDVREETPALYPSAWNIGTPTKEHANIILKVVARALLPVIQQELEHAGLSELIVRNRELECRVSCGTSLPGPLRIRY